MTLIRLLNKLKGHRTYLFVLLMSLPLLVRTLMLDPDHFVRALEVFSDYLVAISAVLLGSKVGDAAQKYVSKAEKALTKSKKK